MHGTPNEVMNDLLIPAFRNCPDFSPRIKAKILSSNMSAGGNSLKDCIPAITNVHFSFRKTKYTI